MTPFESIQDASHEGVDITDTMSIFYREPEEKSGNVNELHSILYG